MVALSIVLSLLLQAVWAATQQLAFHSYARPTGPSATVMDEEFESWLNHTGNIWGMKGIGIAVTRRVKDEHGEWGDWQTELKGFGVADRRDTPVNEETLFSIGSNTKLFTALGLGLLVEDDAYNLQWNSRIKGILHEQWVLQDKVAEKYARLVDILSHQSGLPRHDLSYSTSDTLRTLVSHLRYLRPSAEFRQTFQYNNQMYSTAGLIIEELTNKTYSSFITDRIIKPLGMTDTTYNATFAAESGKVAEGFLSIPTGQPDGEGKPGFIFKPVPYFDSLVADSVGKPAGGVISNVKDLARWLQTLLLLGRHPDNNATIIPAGAIAKAAEGASIVPFPEIPELSPMVYGFGQEKSRFQGHVIVEHNGGTIGHISAISRAPYDNIGVAILTNTDVGPLVELIKWKLYEKALGLPHVNWDSIYVPPTPIEKPSFHQNLTTAKKTPPILSFKDLAGVYFHPAYGPITLCVVHELGRANCADTVSTVLGTLNGPIPDLVASWDKVWSSHILLNHRDGDYFSVRSIKVFPPPFPDSTDPEVNKPFAVDFGGLQASAKFIYTPTSGEGPLRVEGVATSGGVWGAGRGVKELKGEDRDSAEVWFDRVLGT